MSEACDYTIKIGVDEAGRGPLLGRVYAAACILPMDNSQSRSFDISLLKDSKKFSSFKKIHDVYEYIKQYSSYYAISYADESTIDKMNILQATQKAMHEAIKKVIEKVIIDNNSIELKNIKLCIDGNYFNALSYFHNEKLHVLNHECIVKGDDKEKCISAASILAKVERDLYIMELCESEPELIEKYDILSNKGYGTKKHREGIQNFGYSKYHRMSFKLKSKN
jgi:ribonuclease HII